MQPFSRSYPQQKPQHELDALITKIMLLSETLGKPITREQAIEQYKDGVAGDWFKNDTYTAIIRKAEMNPNLVSDGGFPDMLWLSIKRNDRECIHDWRDLQTIKNMLIGEENEAVEIYPAESRLVDTANQYHLWVFVDATIRFPFGFHDGRLVNDTFSIDGAKQRKFSTHENKVE